MMSSSHYEDAGWPLRKISAPHELNDVLLNGWQETTGGDPNSSSTARQTSGSSFLHSLEDLSRLPVQGNLRFLSLLESRLDDYWRATRLEKTVVKVDVLNAWRSQTPLGRFLVLDLPSDGKYSSSGLALWKDVGDTQARRYIGKAFKQLSKMRNQQPNSDQEKLPQKHEESFDKTKEKQINAYPPPIPKREVANSGKTERRISQVLRTSQAQGKLFGREEDQARLINIWRRQKFLLDQGISEYTDANGPNNDVDMVLIQGETGVGKTSFAMSLPALVASEYDGPSFFLKAQFEYMRQNDANAVFLELIRDFCRQLKQYHSNNTTQHHGLLIAHYRDALVECLENQTALLTSLVPELEFVLNYDDAESSSGTSMDNSSKNNEQQVHRGALGLQRIKLAFAVFFKAVASVNTDCPLVLLIENLHWATESALDVLRYLVTDKSNSGILFMATTRTDVVEKVNGNILTIPSQSKECPNVNVHTFQIKNLERESIRWMLAESASLKPEQVESLTSVFYSMTKGNPMFICELLRNLQEEGLLRLDSDSKQWTCDFHLLPLALEGVQNVPDLFTAKLLDLSDVTRDILKSAACLGSSQLDVEILCAIHSQDNVLAALEIAETENFLQKQESTYAFTSDGIQQAIYELIPENVRSRAHLRIGQVLWSGVEERQNDEEFVSVVLRQTMLGGHFIQEEDDRRAVATLCLRAGAKSINSAGFQTASEYLDFGICILRKERMWGRDNYDLCLRLHNAAIEVCYCIGKFDDFDTLVEGVLENARSFEDAFLARSTQMYSLGSRNRLFEAIQMGSATLRALEEPFQSTNPSDYHVNKALKRLKKLYAGLSDIDITSLAKMEDKQKLDVMQTLNHLILYSFYAQPKLSAIIVMRMIELSINYGLATTSSVGFAFFGMFLCGRDEIDEGYRFGKLSLKIYDVFKTEAWLSRTTAAFYGCIYSWKHPVQAGMEPLRRGYHVGIETGDIEYAMLNASMTCWNFVEVLRLPVLVRQTSEILQRAEFLGQGLTESLLRPILSMCKRFCEPDGSQQVVLVEDDGNPVTLVWKRFYAMKQAYLFGDYRLAESFSDTTCHIYGQGYGGSDVAYTMFYESLVLLAQARRGVRRRRHTAKVHRHLKRMKFWASHSPVNFLGKQLLMEAELAAVKGDRLTALEKYRSSILHSRELGSDLQEALCNERLARYFLESKFDEESAAPVLKRSRELYARWGGQAKLQQLDEEFGTDLW